MNKFKVVFDDLAELTRGAIKDRPVDFSLVFSASSFEQAEIVITKAMEDTKLGKWHIEEVHEN